jgi:hypothetical protein
VKLAVEFQKDFRPLGPVILRPPLPASAQVKLRPETSEAGAVKERTWQSCNCFLRESCEKDPFDFAEPDSMLETQSLDSFSRIEEESATRRE